jgi:hypothetical protein
MTTQQRPERPGRPQATGASKATAIGVWIIAIPFVVCCALPLIGLMLQGAGMAAHATWPVLVGLAVIGAVILAWRRMSRD